MKKLGSLMVVCILLILAVRVSAQETIKLAVFEPLSGTFKDIGERYLEGVQYAAKVINESGGLLGRRLEVIPVDSELKPDVATRKAQNLILRDNVKFFAGGTGSSVGAALSELAARNNLIMFTYGMDASSLTGVRCNRNFFRAGGSTDGRSIALAQMIAKQGYKRIAIIAQDYSFGHEATAAFKKKIAELNPAATIVAELYHPAGTRDFAPYASRMIAARPDVIFTPNWGNDLTLLLRQGRPMGLKQRIYSYYINDEVMIKALGDDSLIIGDRGAEVYVLTIPTKKNQEFVEGFFKDKGYYPTWLRGKAYMGTMFWAEAVKTAGSADVNAVIKAWQGLSYDGIAGTWTMRACDNQAQTPYWSVEIVKESKFFPHAFEGRTAMIPAKAVEVPCELTGCVMK